MIKSIYDKQQASKTKQKQKGNKKENKSRTLGIEKFIPGNDAKRMLFPLYTPRVNVEKLSIHWVCPWGQVSSQGVVT
jgi:hypothetical protein